MQVLRSNTVVRVSAWEIVSKSNDKVIGKVTRENETLYVAYLIRDGVVTGVHKFEYLDEAYECILRAFESGRV